MWLLAGATLSSKMTAPSPGCNILLQDGSPRSQGRRAHGECSVPEQHLHFPGRCLPQVIPRSPGWRLTDAVRIVAPRLPTTGAVHYSPEGLEDESSGHKPRTTAAIPSGVSTPGGCRCKARARDIYVADRLNSHQSKMLLLFPSNAESHERVTSLLQQQSKCPA